MEKVELKLQAQYISKDEEVKNRINAIIRDNQVVLLVAPQGTGKSTYFKNLKEFKRVFVSPTLSTAYQVEESTKTAVSRGRTDFTLHVYGYTDLFGNSKCGITSTTFGSSEGLIIGQMVDGNDVLIIDEIHKLVQYSSFGHANVTSTLNLIKEFISKGKKIVFTTATPGLMECLYDVDGFPSIDVYCNVICDRQYITKCTVLNGFNNSKLKKLLIDNKTDSNFQIMLYNNTRDIAKLEKSLCEKGMKVLSVDGKQYQKDKFKKKIDNFKKGNYQGYKALLATSWMDVGLDFDGTNITHVYCLFDKYYTTGDFTIIQQMMARTRNSTPALYINKPHITDSEYRLLNQGLPKKTSIEDLHDLALDIIENYKKGLIKDIDVRNYYGIYDNGNSNDDCKYGFSLITLNYQLYKMDEKLNIINNKEVLKEILNVEKIKYEPKVKNKKTFTSEEYIEITEQIIEGQWYSKAEIVIMLKGIAERLTYDRPIEFLKRELSSYTIVESKKRINGKSTRGYQFIRNY